jgi:hypothetical protein
MAFDSLQLLAAVALFGACVGAWILSAPLKASARLHLRFAAMLLSALAVGTVLALGDVAALLLLPLSAPALALAALARFARTPGPVTATVALVAGLACGLGALVTGFAMPALIVVILSGLCVIAASLNAMAAIPALSGVALAASGLCFLQAGAGAGTLLLMAAAVFGLARAQLLRSTSSAWRGAALP